MIDGTAVAVGSACLNPPCLERQLEWRRPLPHQVYEVPDEAPTNLPEGEEEGYPMLIYQFMHAQVTLPTCLRAGF